MGWTCKFKSNKEITVEIIEDVLKDLPKQFWSNPIGFINPLHDNGWGWTTCVDIHKPNGEKFYISGSASMSGHIAKPMANYLKEKLEERGYDIELEFNW